MSAFRRAPIAPWTWPLTSTRRTTLTLWSDRSSPRLFGTDRKSQRSIFGVRRFCPMVKKSLSMLPSLRGYIRGHQLPSPLLLFVRVTVGTLTHNVGYRSKDFKKGVDRVLQGGSTARPSSFLFLTSLPTVPPYLATFHWIAERNRLQRLPGASCLFFR